MSETIYQIYDRIFKRIFSLSNLAMINLINGLFGTNHSPDSTVEYLNKEFVNRHLEKRFADILLSIQGSLYHLEAQMVFDGSIVVRVFEYGFQHAISNRENNSVLQFPEPVVIYLDTGVEVPEYSFLTLDFGTQGTFAYQVKNFLYQKHEIQELNQRKLIILIPFQLLKLRKLIEKEPTKENFTLLQNVIINDIIGSIIANQQVGNITMDDANQLQELTLQLYDHIYAHYEELGGYSNMKPLLEGAIELPLDKYRIRIDELEEKTTSLEEKNTSLEQEKVSWEEEKNSLEEKTTSLEEKNTSLEEEVKRLRELLKEKDNS